MPDTIPDLDTAATAADQVDKTDEQLWQEMEAEEAGETTVDDDPQPKEQADMADPSDPDPSPAKTDDKGNDGDVTAGMDPAALQAQIDRLQHAVKSEKGRTAASRREIEELRRQIADAEKTQRTNEDESNLQQRRDKIKATSEEYADVIGPLAEQVAELDKRIDTLNAREAKQLDSMRGQLTEKMEAELGVFQTEHPDGFQTIVQNRATFDAWIEDQPKNLRDIYAANEQAIVDGGSAALLVGMFKQALLDGNGNPAPANTEQNRLSTRRDRQLAGAKTTRSNTTSPTTSAPPKDSADDAVHWNYFEQLDKSKKA